MSAEPDYLPADALAEEEPKYLRRQKPVEIRKRKFSRKAWPLYRRVLVGGIAALAVGFALYEAGELLPVFSRRACWRAPTRLRFKGNRFVPRDAIAEKFSADMGRSVVRVPLDGAPRGAGNAAVGGAGPRPARAAEPDSRGDHRAHARGVSAHGAANFPWWMRTA